MPHYCTFSNEAMGLRHFQIEKAAKKPKAVTMRPIAWCASYWHALPFSLFADISVLIYSNMYHSKGLFQVHFDQFLIIDL